MSGEPQPPSRSDDDLRVRAWLLLGAALGALGSVAALGCLLPFLGIVVVAAALTYGSDTAWALMVVASLLVVGLLVWLVRPRR
jgi:hypothetical protein